MPGDTIDMQHARFSERLRQLSWQDHEEAATSRFVHALFSGALPLAGYTALAAQHHFIYSALEAVGDTMRDHPDAGPFVFDELRRVAPLERDLVALVGDDWRTTIEPLPSTVAYCARISATAGDWPGGFIAHHYTRYLGDLSGGQMIARAVGRAYEFVDGAGMAFYQFDAIDDLDAFKARYRGLLDGLPWDVDEQNRVIAELKAAYRHNTAVFAELDARFTPGEAG